MGINNKRNLPCPCGSGKKYKNCCINKSDDTLFTNPHNFLESYKVVRKESRIKQCLHPNKKSCSERIIGAHSIQNNKILKQISSNGLLYMPCPKPDNPFAFMTSWGRKQATVFTGFCGYHDNLTFEPIENNDFDKSDMHIFLYSYRCFAIEYHKKLEVANMKKNIFKRKPSLMSMKTKDDPFGGMEMAIKDFQHVKEQFDNALLTQKYDIVSSVIWDFPHPIRFAASGYEAPSKDLRGGEIQNLLDFKTIAEHIFVIVFPEGNKTYCIISWLKTNDKLFATYRNQLTNLNAQERKNYINNTLPIISENIAINPDSWDNMDRAKRDEFGALIWGASDISELSGNFYNRLEAPTFDLFNL